jgi:integrase
LKTRLTKTVVEDLVAEPRDRFVWDDRLPGFGVKVTPKGARIYVYQYRPKHARNTRRYTIGGHGAPWTTEKARDAANDLAARVRLGDDPFGAEKARAESTLAKQSKAAEARVQRAKDRIELVTTEFVERYAKLKNRNWAESQRIFDREVLPYWKGRSVRSISRKDVIELIDRVQDRAPTMARNVFAQLRKLFGWCVERDLIEASPFIGLRPPPLPKARDRWLNDAEIKLFWKACDALGAPFGQLFQLLLLTAQRRDEVTGMRWSELNLKKAEWIIPAARAKNNKEHIVDLAPAAVSIIERIALAQEKARLNEPAPKASDVADLLAQTSALLFSTTGETAVSGHGHAKALLDLHVETVRLTLARKAKVQKDAGPIPAWRIHDLRRTAATGMASLGYPPHVIERVLNHVSGVTSGLVGVYQHYQYRAERKAALLAWAEHVSTVIGELEG